MSSELLSSLLKEVSRSFYLTMRVLPVGVRSQISLAYLLARTSDTIADTELVPLECRLRALRDFDQRIQGASSQLLDFGQLSQSQASPAEKILLQRCEESLGLLAHLPEEDRQLIREVLKTIISGQELDLQRFAAAKEGKIVGLQSEAELDDYTYRVAGCVGEFWTKICRRRLFPKSALDDRWLMEQGIRFGQGLQMVNILRDLPRDLRNGRCYLPQARLAKAGLAPQDLLRPENESRFRPLYNEYLAKAEGHLRAGWEYTNALPRNQGRVRLGCAWPILIGLKTLQRLKNQNVLDPSLRVKVSRGEVRNLMVKSLALYPFARAWKAQANP